MNSYKLLLNYLQLSAQIVEMENKRREIAAMLSTTINNEISTGDIVIKIDTVTKSYFDEATFKEYEPELYRDYLESKESLTIKVELDV